MASTATHRSPKTTRRPGRTRKAHSSDVRATARSQTTAEPGPTAENQTGSTHSRHNWTSPTIWPSPSSSQVSNETYNLRYYPIRVRTSVPSASPEPSRAHRRHDVSSARMKRSPDESNGLQRKMQQMREIRTQGSSLPQRNESKVRMIQSLCDPCSTNTPMLTRNLAQVAQMAGYVGHDTKYRQCAFEQIYPICCIRSGTL